MGGLSTEHHHNPRFMQPLLPNFLNDFSIPTSFMKQLESELKMQAETVVLMSEYQPSRHWVVTLKQARFFTNGWSQFCLHHGFQVGDFLLFTYHSHFLFHVSAFDPLSASLRLPLKTPAHGIPSKLHTSSCVVNLTRYNVEKAIILLPVGFVRKHGLQHRRCQVMIKDAKRRLWPAFLNYKKCDGQVYIKRGWKPFLAANHLKPGNLLCIQHLKGGTCPTFKCYRPKRTKVESNSAPKTTPKEGQAKSVTILSSKQDQSQHLSCYVHLTSYAIKNSWIYIPAHFVRESGLDYQSCEVQVVDEEERTWQVSMGGKKGYAKSFICRGWRDVQTANGFSRGDVICFQLLEAGECPTLRCYRTNR